MLSRRRRLVPLLVFAATTWAVGSCGGDKGTDPVVPTSIELTPGLDSLTALGDQQVLTATVKNGDGGVMTGVTLTWTSSSPGVATVVGGTVTAIANGAAQITASASGVSGSAIIVVKQAVATVTLTPAIDTLRSIGDTTVITPTARDSRSNTVAGALFTWTSSTPAAVAVTTTGRAVAMATGASTITATSEGQSGTASMIVRQRGAKLAVKTQPGSAQSGFTLATQPVVELQDARANLVRSDTGTQVVATINGTGASLQGTLNVVTVGGVATYTNIGVTGIVGNYTLVFKTAALDSALSSAFTVSPGAASLAQSVVTVSKPSVFSGDTALIKLQAKDEAGNNVLSGGLAVAFTLGAGTSTGTIGPVSDRGNGTYDAVLTAAVAGSARSVEATIGGLAVTTVKPAFSVVAGTVHTVTLDRDTATIATGDSIAFATTLKDAANNATTAPVTFTSLNTGVASITPSGKALGVSKGTALVVASSQGKADTASLTVEGLPALISISPDTARLSAIGATKALAGVVTDASSAVVTTATIHWSTGNPAIATVDPVTGVVVAVANGTVQVFATSGPRSDSLPVIVQQTVKTFVITKNRDTLAFINDTLRVVATAKDSLGVTVSGAPVTWSSSNAAVLSVTGAGIVRSTGVGNAYARAANGLVIDSILVKVNSVLGQSCDVSGGTLRNGSITTAELWRAVDSPHRIPTGGILADSTAVITVEPGALVCVPANMSLQFRFHAQLRAIGTAANPIVFRPFSEAAAWAGMDFQVGPVDTSILRHVRIEHAAHNGQFYAVYGGQGIVLIDSSVVRQSRHGAVRVQAGSRILHTTIDTAGTENALVPAVNLGTGVSWIGSTLRKAAGMGMITTGATISGGRIENSGGIGLYAYETAASTAPVRIVGSTTYPLMADPQTIARMYPSFEAQDSLVGNGRDSIVVRCCTMTSGSAYVSSVMPWLIRETVVFSGSATLNVGPSALVALDSVTQIFFDGNARLLAIGSTGFESRIERRNSTSPGQIQFRAFQGGSQGADTSRIRHAILTRVSLYQSAGPPGTGVVAGDDRGSVVKIDSSQILKAGAVELTRWHSGIAHSTVDSAALLLGDSTYMDSTTVSNSPLWGVSSTGFGVRITRGRIENSAEIGLQVTRPMRPSILPRIIGGASYPLRIVPQVLSTFFTAYGVEDSLTGNAKDSVQLGNEYITITGSPKLGNGIPWLFTTYANVGGTLTVEPGARLVFNHDALLGFDAGGRLVARGTAAEKILFTARDPSAGWIGITVAGGATDTTWLTNVTVAYGGRDIAAIRNFSAGMLWIDSTVVRQSRQIGIQTFATGTSIRRTVIDTAGTAVVSPGLQIAASIYLDSITVRKASGIGIEMPHLAKPGSGFLRVRQSGLYPLRTWGSNLDMFFPTRGLQDSITGNGIDTLVVVGGGAIESTTQYVRPDMPWRSGLLNVRTTGKLVVEPGSGIAFDSGSTLYVVSGGRLDARGTAANKVKFTGVGGLPRTWIGIDFSGGSDTSWITNAIVEYTGSNLNTAGIRTFGILYMDSVRVRQGGPVHVRGGSSFMRSRIDTIPASNMGWAGYAEDSSKWVSDTILQVPGNGLQAYGKSTVLGGLIKNFGGSGLWAFNTLGTLGGGTRITGGAGHPIEIYAKSVTQMFPNAAAWDSVKGNAKDTAHVYYGGDSIGGNVLVRKGMPWLVHSDARVKDTMTIEPGAGIAFASNALLHVMAGARLIAVGTPAESIVFKARNPAQPFHTVIFNGTSNDTSFLKYARIEGGGNFNAALNGQGGVVVRIDSSRVVNSRRGAVILRGSGSWLKGSVVEDAGLDSAAAAVTLDVGTAIIGGTITGSRGIGLDVGGTTGGALSSTIASTLPRISGGSSYPLRLSTANVSRLLKTSDDIDSLANNAKDTVVLSGGTTSSDTLTLWKKAYRVQTSLNAASNSVLTIKPGATLSMDSDAGFLFTTNSRLDARGTAADTITFRASTAVSGWRGIHINTSSTDSSFLVNARLSHSASDIHGVDLASGHPMRIDSTRFLAMAGTAVYANGAVRIRRTIVDSSATSGGLPALMLGSGSTVDSTLVRKSGGVGIQLVGGASGVTIARSEITLSAADGILASGNAGGIVVSASNLYDNGGLGINSTSGNIVTATGNWWGSTGGPNGIGGDGVASSTFVNSTSYVLSILPLFTF